jgi:hypothetical protein
LEQDDRRKIEKARERLVLCRLMIDIMRTVHGAHAPVSEPFGTSLESIFIGLCVAIGDLEGKPFSVAKIAAYMRVPRTTVIRRLAKLQSWGLIDCRGRYYYMQEKALNSVNAMRSYKEVRSILSKATEELSALATFAGLTACPAGELQRQCAGRLPPTLPSVKRDRNTRPVRVR